MSMDNETCEVFMDAMCIIMLSDNLILPEEKARIHEMMAKTGSTWTAEQIDLWMDTFVTRLGKKCLDEILEDTCGTLSETGANLRNKIFINCFNAVAGADGIIDAAEMKTLNKLRSALT